MAASKDFQLVRLKQGKQTFEVMTNPGSVPKFRKGEVDIGQVLYTDVIFKNHSKAEKASDAELSTGFETCDIKEVAKIICNKGDLQLTAAERQEKVTKKRAQIVSYLNKYYIDPKTKLPHPPARLDSALTDIKYRVDPELPVEKQVAEVMKNITRVLAMRKCEMEATLSIPHQYVGSCGNAISRFLTVKSEDWTAQGCDYEVTLVPGDYDPCVKELQRITDGNFQLEVAGGIAATTEEPEPSGKGKKGGGKQGGGKQGGKQGGGRGKRK
mmetsp:Transcript_17460/g.27311  ORF Transcript_17460/g.27311 Transcript_17460/m.27311 type:complete len:269 (-) Transcript_17460:315-1121(-)|eukprot:CAMPEP_0201521136 /NCGR_PEP_ID=MMETSP0161_2-20130828/14240_1 /ASSEMBLY_ACC=CAM_ASM_000251 /TAXON_ID=180227 /ORGANISM="Neoparamoeba aestuarina, Strain SoJaBio B1-5/56/2" /LENGTH=268 /DNA_ID=CAMNT_0047919713 /DNA_START=51 /DNA_END=857 /DNA_ORIENTATION=+